MFSTAENLESATWISTEDLILLDRTPVKGDYVLGADGYVGTITDKSGVICTLSTPIDMKIQGPQGIQGEVGPQGPQGVQGNVGPAGPDGTPVAGRSYVSSLDGVSGKHVISIPLDDYIGNAVYRFIPKGVYESSSVDYFELLLNDVLVVNKNMSLIDAFIIRKSSSSVNLNFYNFRS